ncbi:MAG: hypothetical protein ACP5GH_04660 [Nitrososphaeria archaeon]
MSFWRHIPKWKISILGAVVLFGAIFVFLALERPLFPYRELLAAVGGALIGQIALFVPEIDKAKERQERTKKEGITSLLLGKEIAIAALGGYNTSFTNLGFEEGKFISYCNILGISGENIFNLIKAVIMKSNTQNDSLTNIKYIIDEIEGFLSSKDPALVSLFNIGIKAVAILSIRMHPIYPNQPELLSEAIKYIENQKEILNKSKYSMLWEIVIAPILKVLSSDEFTNEVDRVKALESIFDELNKQILE